MGRFISLLGVHTREVYMKYTIAFSRDGGEWELWGGFLDSLDWWTLCVRDDREILEKVIESWNDNGIRCMIIEIDNE